MGVVDGIKRAVLFTNMRIKFSSVILLFLRTMTFVSGDTIQQLQDILSKTYYGFMDRNVFSYDIPLVHRIYSKNPGDCVSEGIGYGLLMSVWMDNENNFKKIVSAADTYMWTGSYHNWRVDINGNVLDYGAATDAEQDIAAALIIATRKPWVDSSKGGFYEQRARAILETIWNTMIRDGIVIPGPQWALGAYNPSYFSPAWYRLFAEFDTLHDWSHIIGLNYEVLQKSQGYTLGLVPDWMKTDGFDDADDFNRFMNGKVFYKDAIRIFWRIGMDLYAFGSGDAMNFMQNAYHFIQSQGGPSAANFYFMNGSLIPEKQSIVDINGYEIMGSFREHNHLTVAMFNTVPYSLEIKPEYKIYYDRLVRFYTTGNGYWGNENDAMYNEDFYYDQCLAWFGAHFMYLVMSEGSL